MTKIINGKEIAQEIIDELRKFPKPQKKLAAVFVGENPASASFLRQKNKIADELGIQFELFKFPDEISEDELIKNVKKIGDDPMIGGMIVQLPLPEKFNRDKVLKAINPDKDIDALVTKKVAALPVGVVKDILEKINYDPKDKTVAVVGRGILIGKPIAEWLLGKCREVIVLHRGSDFGELKRADLVISGVGRAGLVKPGMLKPGAGVIDFGYDLIDGKIRGDFDVRQIENWKLKISFYTPTPGGTGPILVAELFRNFYTLNQ
jgi:methylenetetrahydrofolate dehydrogenase (NADP+)/methenyltetrahydrofolate cyclohydrolase